MSELMKHGFSITKKILIKSIGQAIRLDKTTSPADLIFFLA